VRKEKAVFVDTVGWIALVHREDNLHQEVTNVYRDIGRVRRITTDAVLVESCNAFSNATMRPLALALMEKIEKAEDIDVLEVIHVSEELIKEGWELFKNRMDKEWSLTDCISFIVMKNMGVSKAITSDHHFEQAGFTILIKDQ
jgi:predicted nucleic acid-binding protein